MFRKSALFVVLLPAAMIIFFVTANGAGQAAEVEILFLHHSTGGNVYTEGEVAEWIRNYNDNRGTDYHITARSYPDKPYSWSNYPYDYWHLWIDGACDNDEPGITCLEALAADYDVIIFKHCFPGADVLADTGSPAVSSDRKSLENYRLQYRALRNRMDSYPNTIFIVWTLAPRHRLATSPDNAARAAQFVDWVKNDFLSEDGEEHPNIFIFDFWGIAAEPDAAPVNGAVNCLKYIYERSHVDSNSHPNTLANETAGPLFAARIVEVVESFAGGEETIPEAGEENSNTGETGDSSGGGDGSGGSCFLSGFFAAHGAGQSPSAEPGHTLFPLYPGAKAGGSQ